MFKISTALLSALAARWAAKINGGVAHFRGWHIKHGRFGKSTYKDPRFPTMRDPESLWAGSFPTVERAP
jgi:hypothetical protein